jgi:O-antigen ligase
MSRQVASTISLSPFRSTTELMKLTSYVMAAWLARVFGRSSMKAYQLLDAVIIIGALYAAYGFVLLLVGQSQFEFFYGTPLQQIANEFPGPFVNRNNYVTYEGIVAVCAGSRLVTKVWDLTDVPQSRRRRLLNIVNWIVGEGAIWLLATVLAYSAVIMTGSRAGNLATWSATLALLLIGLGLVRRKKGRGVLLGLIASAIAAGFGLLAINGSTFAARLDDISGPDTTRLMLWHAALKMIRDAPLTGWGLGTYQLVYPIYATKYLHLVMDKAHNDLLEFAAGIGLPAAILWWGSLAWLAAICARGISARKRHRVLPAVGLGATIVVAVHSAFDFSLQMPAIALTFAVILGLGIAQAFPSSQGTSP